MTIETPDEARHAEKMREKQEVQSRIVATKTIEKGLLIVHTGKGKGKTSAALGMVVRAIGHGMKVGVVQWALPPCLNDRRPFVADEIPVRQ